MSKTQRFRVAALAPQLAHSILTCMGVEVQLHSFLTSALGQLYDTATLFPGKKVPESPEKEAGWALERARTFWKETNLLTVSRIERRIVQPVASHCTD
jgi:hypothetical protein